VDVAGVLAVDFIVVGVAVHGFGDIGRVRLVVVVAVISDSALAGVICGLVVMNDAVDVCC